MRVFLQVALSSITAAQAALSLSAPLHVVGFADEEGVRFQSTFLGSRAMVGAHWVPFFQSHFSVTKPVVQYGGGAPPVHLP